MHRLPTQQGRRVRLSVRAVMRHAFVNSAGLNFSSLYSLHTYTVFNQNISNQSALNIYVAKVLAYYEMKQV